MAESGFDITPASEIMAILCLSTDEDDLRRRVENILLGITIDNKPFTVKDLGVAGAICVLLKDALNPNLVQTTENTPAFVHGGPFANIAHGCNSVIATRLAMSFSDYTITEAGFGADLGAEKFLDIKCRKAGLQPALTVMVATSQALKMHGGVPYEDIKKHNDEALVKGLDNLFQHIENIQKYGQKVVVAFNRYATDTDDEVALVKEKCRQKGVSLECNDAYAKGGEGAVKLAQLVVDTIENNPSEPLKFCYQLDDDIKTKITKVAKEIYRAESVTFSKQAERNIALAERLGMADFPVCIAKTQYSFSADPKAYGCPRGFTINIRDVVINSGAEMIVAVSGDIMRMPGLPKHPLAEKIDIVNGLIEGLD
jgi:formate--tetrahydrofolate ligase